MSFWHLFIQQVIESFRETNLDMDQVRFGMHAFGITYLIFGVSSIKKMLRIQEKRLREAMPKIHEDSDFVTIYDGELQNFRVRDQNYDVPKIFPQELEDYVGVPTVQHLVHWGLQLEALPVQQALDIKRVITASAAIHGRPIPKVFRCIDDRTKALWVRLRFDMELKNVDAYYLHSRALPQLDGQRPVSPEELLTYLDALQAVGELVYQHSLKRDFPAFSIFLRNLTDTRDVSKGPTLDRFAVQSLVTAYSVKTGFKIPASYIRCDTLAWQLSELQIPLS